MKANYHKYIMNEKSYDRETLKVIDINLIEILMLIYKNFKKILILYFLLIMCFVGYFYTFGRDYNINLQVNLFIFEKDVITGCDINCKIFSTLRFAIEGNDKFKMLNIKKVRFNNNNNNYNRHEIIFHSSNFYLQDELDSELALINKKLKKYFLDEAVREKEILKNIPFQNLTEELKKRFISIDQITSFYQNINAAIVLGKTYPLRPQISDMFLLLSLSILMMLLRVFFIDIIKSIREYGANNNQI